MPSSDLLLNVKQIAGYPGGGILPLDTLVLQRGGLGGPYYSVSVETLVGDGLASAGPLSVGLGAPPSDAYGSQVFLGGVCSTWDGAWIWNAYAGSIPMQEFNFLTNGPAAILQCDAALGWRFFWMQSNGGLGQQAKITAEPLSISPDGYLTVADQVHLGRDPQLPQEAATAQWVTEQIIGSTNVLMAMYNTQTVWSFNNRTGSVILNLCDVMGAGGAPINSPVFQGQPTAPTPVPASNDNTIATTQWVWQSIAAQFQTDVVTSFNGRAGDITLIAADITGAGGALLASPAFTGVPTAPTATPLSDNTQIATTAYVDNALATFNLSAYAPLNSPNFSGTPTAPTPPAAASDGRIATTAFVHNAIVAATTGVSSFNTRTGAVVLTGADISSAGGALLAGPIFTGVPAAPTAAPGTNTTQLATTAYVMAALAGGGNVVSFNGRSGAITLTTADVTGAGGAPINSPTLTGTPLAPTATAGTSTTQIATTAFVANAITALGTVVSSFNGRSGAVSLAANDISAAGGAVLASPAFSGTPTAPTATPGTNTAQIATTSFVMAAIAAGGGVSSVNGRTGAITIIGTDITGAGGALLAGPAFTGVPSAPTAAVGTNSTQLATTAFVAAALTSSANVYSFNGRTGAVTLQTSDITGAGGAVLASPAFSGTPTAPTATPGTNTTVLATTAFVQQAINAIGAGVVSFNGRTGAVTLLNNDITAAGGAVLASPAFTGVPSAPTAAPGTSTTQIATTAFVSGNFLPISGGTLTGKLGVNSQGIPGDAGAGLALNVGGDVMLAGQYNFGFNAYAVSGNTWKAPAAGLGAVISNAGTALTVSLTGGLTAGQTYTLANTHAFYPNGNLTCTGTVTGTSFVTGGNTLYGPNGAAFQGAAQLAMVVPTTATPSLALYSAGAATSSNIILSNGLGAYSIINNFVFNGSTPAAVAYYNNNTAGNYVYWTIAFSSAREIKRNLKRAAKDALAAIARVPIYECDMTQPVPGAVEQHWDWSFIADEIEKEIPLAIFQPPDDKGYVGVRELPIVVTLMKAVQQLLTRVETLEARLAA